MHLAGLLTIDPSSVHEDRPAKQAPSWAVCYKLWSLHDDPGSLSCLTWSASVYTTWTSFLQSGVGLPLYIAACTATSSNAHTPQDPCCIIPEMPNLWP